MLNHLLTMGGYGVYVWSAYGITLGVFGINLIIDLRERQRVKKIIKQYQLHSNS